MQINLKQREIIEALRQYVIKKGIDLTGKTVDCAFTAGRKDSGISVEIQIEDLDIPGFSDQTGDEEDTPVAFETPSTTTAPKEPGTDATPIKAAVSTIFG
jgi:hypothetical protein